MTFSCVLIFQDQITDILHITEGMTFDLTKEDDNT